MAEEEETEASFTFEEIFEKEHISAVFIGHVDAGKSTLAGRVLLDVGAVDKRTIEKYEKEAISLNRESWFLAFIMDVNEEERAKGKTVEVGHAHFNMKQKRVTILDAPGHAKFVPEMIDGAQQADIAVLVISARKGEFEAGFKREGQTREHALLAYTLGVRKLIVAVNKMDEETVKWSEKRYNDIQNELKKFLKGCGFKVKRDVTFIPISAYTGENVSKKLEITPANKWAENINEGMSLLETIDNFKITSSSNASKNSKSENASRIRVPILSTQTDRGNVLVVAKIETGTLKPGMSLFVSPVNLKCTIDTISIDKHEITSQNIKKNVIKSGEVVTLRLKGVEENDVQKGFVLSDELLSHKKFQAQLRIVETLDHRPLFTAGYKPILHVHTLNEEVTVSDLICKHVIDKKTGVMSKDKKIKFAKAGDIVTVTIKLEQSIAIESYDNDPVMGRLTLRDEGKTIAIGKITRLPKAKKVEE